METKQPVRRLCSEIQLFDLCDLDYCKKKEGRYCTNPEALEKFEAIKEEDETEYVADEEYSDEEEEDSGEDFESDDYDED